MIRERKREKRWNVEREEKREEVFIKRNKKKRENGGDVL